MGQLTSWPTMSADRCGAGDLPLSEGIQAPYFSLPDADMEVFDLAAALQTKVVVLHFYPRDVMPSSLKQAIAFSERERDFARLGAMLVGVSLDECMTHADFRDEHGIAMELLSDPEGDVCRQYRVWQQRQTDGVVRPVVQRATFIIGCDGMLLHADYNVDVRDHTQKVLAQLKSLSGRSNGNPQEHRRHA